MYDVNSAGLGLEPDSRQEEPTLQANGFHGNSIYPVPESGLLKRIALARGRLERTRSRVASMPSDLGEVNRTQLEYCELLSNLHVLERSHFNR